MGPRKGERGMALLVVLLILAVMVIVAANMSGRLQIELRRTANQVAGKQAWWYALSAEALVAKALAQDAKDNANVTHLGQYWARKETVFPVPDGQLKGEVRDLYGCFNLNSLEARIGGTNPNGGTNPDGSQPGGTANPDDPLSQPLPAQAFRILLTELGMDEYDAVQLTDALRDWIDKDTVLVSSYGAEDAYYEGLNPPYLPANQRLLSLSELRMVRGVTPDLYRKLSPYLCVRPDGELKVNVNTLAADQGALLTALSLGKLPADEAKRILTDRPRNGWKSSDEFLQQVPAWEQKARASVVVKSERFAARLVAEVGDSRAFLVSEFQREKDNKFKVVRRLQESGETLK
ncbi:general secretion pathway protein K [Aeromonas diversa CDC 2478-85]|uniref:Type II secretion system protein K n=1 Tax=Aeromonas diversa CDC 2478-85 TaxID=1268237 RepID=N9TYZ3_9GAMM|nr:type II secretion system minor pseudopilin GspK [Aeromonas diversa]ENY71265.1 general secretion pathway protein K [Aeromonas diversa CDC 2478-85]